MKGEQQDKDKDTETVSAVKTDRRRKRKNWLKRKLQMWFCIPYMGCREGERQRNERGKEKRRGKGGRDKGKRGGGDKRQSLAWRQAAFQYHPASYTDAHTKSTPCKWYRSTSGDFPSPKIRADICPPPPQPTSNTEADSQIKIARGTIQTLLPFCWECLLT